MVDVRRAREDERDRLVASTAHAFGFRYTGALAGDLAGAIEMDRAYVAVDGDEIVGTGCTLSLELTVPGRRTVRAGGLSWIGVRSTHRRRGILRRIMDLHFEDIAACREPLGLLFASEAAIYRRFGYGPATMDHRYALDTVRARFDPPEDPGRLELVDRDHALEILPSLQERIRRATVGEVSRGEEAWRAHLAELEESPESERPVFHVIHRDADGEPDGYALHRVVDDDWGDGIPQMRVRAALAATSPRTRLLLWRYLADLDLVGEVTVPLGRPDESLRWLLDDPRHLRTTRVNDGLWARICDVPAALSARRYEVEDRITIEVVDRGPVAAGGRFTLIGSPQEASCVETDEPAEIELDVAALSSAYLGGVSLRSLADAGLVTEHRPGAVSRADRLLRTTVPPHCSTEF